MALWEYKVITSGKGGFATPALLEKFLNELGRDEWEIVEFRSLPDNALAFTGLARRSTQRDWTLEDAAAAAAKAEAEKLRAEFSAKFQAATSNAPAAEEKAPSFLEEKSAPDDGFRKPVDTSRDNDPDAPDDDAGEKDEWDKLAEEDELPSFFDALKPHMRRNQRGPGMSVGTDYLAKKWGLAEEDIKGALVECGLQIPADENARPVYVEFEGDLYWVNINRRGEVWINTREKPRPVFRIVQGAKVAQETVEEPKAENAGPKTEAVRPSRGERAAQQAEMPPPRDPAAPKTESPSPAALPVGPALLDKIRPQMRRNRRGPGGSGSTSFLARALKCTEADLVAGFASLGLVLPPAPTEPPVEVEIGDEIWWLNQDSRGGIWINGRDQRESGPKESRLGAETPSAPPVEKSSETASAEPSAGAAPAPDVFAAVRPLLKETRTGSVAGKLDRVAGELAKSPEDLTSALVGVGLKVPEKSREKPVFVEHAGEIYWLNLNPKGELWVNAKASKFSDAAPATGGTGEGGRKPTRRPRPKKSAGSGQPSGENAG